MSWKANENSTAQIDRRPEPFFTQQMKDTITQRYLPRFETKKGALLPALHEIQHAYGWIPAQALEEIADFLDLAPADVLDTASFYEEYWLKPKGEHLIAVCRSMACEVCDHKKLTDTCREKLGIEVGETTKDGKFTLVELECIGACGGAPAILVDEDLHETVSPDRMAKLIDETRTKPAH